MSERVLPKTLAWLQGTSAPPVAQAWVPGSSEPERRALAALASVARHLSQTVDPSWPDEIVRWLAAAVPLPDEVAAEIDAATEKTPDAALASLYAEVVAGKNRRVLGTFFTPSDEVVLMLDRWTAMEEAPTEVIDVGAGVGVFTAAAAEEWRSSRVTAIDINPVTLGLLAARMKLADVADVDQRLNLVLADYTEWLPKQDDTDTERRLILGNPPYTRWQLIDPSLRDRLADETSELCGRRASLSAYMTAISLQHLRKTDGLCLLLPAQWLESDYASGLRLKIASMTDRRVELWLVKSGMFEDATVDAVVLMVGTSRATPQPFTVAEWHAETPVEIDRSQNVSEWRSWFEAASDQPNEPRTPLRSVATVRRGVATGANQFFVLTDNDVRSHGLPPACLRPVVQRLVHFQDRVDQPSFSALASGEAKWLFSTKLRADLAVATRRYIEHGESERFNERHLCASRSVWHDLEHDIQIPDVIITAMSRDRFHVAPNELRAAITNNLYGWRWDSATPTVIRERIITWLRSDDGQMALRRIARRQGNALLKLEPRALGELLLPSSLFKDLL